jgi:type I restriction enzyme S subunit
MREGWRSVPLLQAGTWLSGGTPATDEPRYWGGDIPWISAASLKDFWITRSDRCVTHVGALNGTRLVPAGTVLFVVRGMSLKSEFRVGVTEREVAFGQDCKAILPTPGIDARFLAFALKARERDILAMVDEAGHGTGRLPTDLIAKLKIGVAELAEQQRIVEILHAADATIDATRKVAEKLETTASALTTAQLTKLACDAPAVVPLSDVADVLSGVTLGSEPGGAGSVELPYLRVANVQDGRIDTSEMKSIRILRAELPKYLLRTGDVLLTEGGDLDKLGRGAMWDGRIPQCITQNHVFRVRCNESRVLPGYLSAYIGSPMGKAYFLKIAKQTTNLASINSTQLKALPLPVPDLPDQSALIDLMTAGSSQVTVERRRLAKLQTLRHGLMDDLPTGRVRVPAR